MIQHFTNTITVDCYIKYISDSQPLTLGVRVPLNCYRDLLRTTSSANGNTFILKMYDAVADPAPHLYTIITAGRPWPQRKSGKIKSAMLLMLLVCLFSKPR